MTEQQTITDDITTARRAWAALELRPDATAGDMAAWLDVAPDALQDAYRWLERAGVVEPWQDSEGRRVLAQPFSVTRY
jgi:hypothetical protein